MAGKSGGVSAVTNAMSIDVEDYFQVSALAKYIARDAWDSIQCRVEGNIDRILTLLSTHDAKATFFTLGWIAERHPRLVRKIVDAGHEVASHGYGHERVTDLTPEKFLVDISTSKKILEDQSGTKVRGYRAPSFSIDANNFHWAFDRLAEAGYTYSSSVYPVQHDHYGVPDAPRFKYVTGAGLTEIPPTTVRAWSRNWPASGGGYFRLLPYSLSRKLIEVVNTRERQPAMFYFHPWEIDPAQPRVRGVDAKSRFRHYVNLSQMESKLGRLLADFRWGRVDQVFLDS